MADDLVPLTIVSTASDADEVERLLEAEGIRYEEQLDAGTEGDEHRVCYLGTRFLVPTAELDRCRRLLASHGLAIGS